MSAGYRNGGVHRLARLLAVLILLPLPAVVYAQQTSELAELLGAGNSDGFEQALDVREFRFPADHGPHPGFRNEWWYVTGNVFDEDGRRYGFELTLFRVALRPDSPAMRDDWQVEQVYFGHVAVTDADGRRFFAHEKMARGAAGLAGSTTTPPRVWIEDWEMRFDGRRWRISAGTAEFGFTLDLDPVKPAVLNGDRGLSQKSSAAGNASYYYSLPRLSVNGRLRLGDRRIDASGSAWMDREWSTSALAADQDGWDWFALQLDDNTELMFYQLRRTDGSVDPLSAGTLIDTSGEARKVAQDELEIRVTNHWDSPRGGRYPAGWTLEIPGEALTLDVTPVIPDQELSAIVRYWEGAVDVRGRRAGKPVSGFGYVELTGYAEDTD